MLGVLHHDRVEANVIINEYELVFIIRPDIDEAKMMATIEKIEGLITDAQGTLLVRDDWGVRKLAYAIDNHLKGRYVLLKFVTTPDAIIELERRIRISDEIIRFLTVRKPGSVDLERRLAEAEEERRKLAEEAARRAADEAAADEMDYDDDEDDDADGSSASL
jgi:small subunit ribosomal protein S6